MKSIRYEDFENGEIVFLKNLCNDLMAFQASRAKIKPEVIEAMSFENRLVPDFQEAFKRVITVAWDGNIAVGFAFATVNDINKININYRPTWARDLNGIGFYPKDYDVPRRIGTFKLLYVMPEYRDLHIGAELSSRIMTWLKSQQDADDLWVFVANGNEDVASFYEKLGFHFSHSVFGDFVRAYKKVNA